MLVAVDTRQAGALLRGRTEPGQTWADVVADLAPGAPAAYVPLPDDGAGIHLRGRGPQGAALTVTPTAVLEDQTGFRSSVSAGSLPLDGAPTPWSGSVPWVPDYGWSASGSNSTASQAPTPAQGRRSGCP